MSDSGTAEFEQIANTQKVNLYKNQDYISLYRYENPSIPYDERREGLVSKKSIAGNWFTNNLADLKAYTKTRIKGERGGKFVVVRIPKVNLDQYDATKLPETKDMDIEAGNYIIPPEASASSQVEVDGIFKDIWEGKKNIPFADWKEADDYIDSNLSDEAIISKLEK